jgi:aspartyl-tRNA(Asn)/glutamyl-tRNA(Gln) amidotransferase subunit A
MTNYFELTLKEINSKLKNKEIKPIDLVNEAFYKIEQNKDYNAFITLNKEESIKKAKELENKEVDNILFGIPIAIKDNILTKGLLTTCASKMLNDFIPIYDATVIKKLNKCNAIIIGKTNMDEFAMGSSNETSYYGPVLNSIDKTKIPGGSSGGSAVSVSKRMIPISLGSDTGGSIRQPAAFNNVVGLKPTYGRVSRYGLVAFASSLDQIGPITKNVEDNALLLNAIVGLDNKDLTMIDTDEDFTSEINKDIKGMKVCIPSFYMNDMVDLNLKNQVIKVIDFLKTNNVSIDYVNIDYIEYVVPLYQTIALAEASSNLARFDGIRYGYKTDKKVNNIDDFYKYTREEGFGDEVKRRIMIGSYVLSGKNVDVYYNKALSIRKKLSNNMYDLFNTYDLIIGPTTTDFPYDLCKNKDANSSFMDDILTIPANMAGLPALSLPIGNDKPIGLQIIGNMFDEKTIYRLASFIEKNFKRGE